MKLAMVTPARDTESPVGAYAHALASSLKERVELTLFVEREPEGASIAGLPTLSVARLDLRRFDHVLHQIGDEAALGFAAPLVRALGGTVVLHDWSLARLACSAHPTLERGGLRAIVTALREGGLAQAAQWRRRSRLGELEAAPALNRSIVRFGDSFLVHSEPLARAVLEDRNAPTPIGLVDPRSEHGAADALERCAGRWDQVADRYVECLQRFPRPRTARRGLLGMALALRRE